MRAVSAPARPEPEVLSPRRVESPGADVLRSLGLEALVEFLETTAYGVCVTGDDHTWVYVNPAGERLIGHRLEDLQGRDYLLHFPPHEREVLLALEGTQREGDTDFYTNTLLRDDRDDVRMTWSGTVMHVDGHELAPAIFHETSPVRPTGLGTAVPSRVDVLDGLVEEAVSATRACAAVLLCEGQDGLLQVAASAGGLPGLGEVVARSACRLSDLVTDLEELVPGRSVYRSDVAEQLVADPVTREWVDRLSCEPWNGGALFRVWCEGSATGLLMVMIPRSLTSPSERELLLWSSLADQASVALGTQRVRAQVSEHSALIERHRIARDLHDSVSQALFSLHARAQVVRRALAADDPALAAEAAEDLELLSRQATTEMRALLGEMRPTADDRGDLVPRLQQLADAVTRRVALPVELTVAPAPLPPLPSSVVEHLPRIAGEALHNTVKHAGASVIRVTVTVDDDLLTLVAEDDGCGFDPTATTGAGLGQRTMRERAALLGGELSVRSAPGQGTTVEVSVSLTCP
jgi:PAS domain S-box-containing protein